MDVYTYIYDQTTWKVDFAPNDPFKKLIVLKTSQNTFETE